MTHLGAALAILASLSSLAALASKDELGMVWTKKSFTSIVTNPTGVSANSDWLIEEYHACQFRPVQIAIGPDGKVYYCHRDGNGVNRLDSDPKSGRITELQVAKDLTRINGLAFYQGNLYVSRSGRFTVARHGVLSETDTGAVTLLKDVDGDGVIDYFHDIVSGLPGAQAPDPIHQNNGIHFDSLGNLYIAVGAHANKAPVIGRFEGTILRARADGSGLKVFARGMRNPFDCVTGPDTELFCTDNDVGYSGANELNHVVEGGHYGHPYVDPYIDPSARHPAGTIAPIWISRKTTLQGIAWVTSPRILEKYRNCLYVAGHPSGEIFVVRLQRTGPTFRAEPEQIATVPQALDIAADDNGNIYVSAYHTSKIYRLHCAR